MGHELLSVPVHLESALCCVVINRGVSFFLGALYTLEFLVEVIEPLLNTRPLGGITPGLR